jgi:hypothetical protein
VVCAALRLTLISNHLADQIAVFLALGEPDRPIRHRCRSRLRAGCGGDEDILRIGDFVCEDNYRGEPGKRSCIPGEGGQNGRKAIADGRPERSCEPSFTMIRRTAKTELQKAHYTGLAATDFVACCASLSLTTSCFSR